MCPIDYPWQFAVCGFGSFNVARENQMQDLVDSINAFDKAYLFSQNQVFIQVNPGSTAGMQIEGPIISISPLHESQRADGKYLQKDDKKTVFKNRVVFPDEQYKQCLNTALKESSDRGDFILGNHGKVLIVYAECSVPAEMIEVLPADNDNGVSEEYIQDILENQQGFRVYSKMKAKPYLHLQNQFFVLTAIVKNQTKNHFVCSTNGDLEQVWWNHDDDEISHCQSAGNLQNGNVEQGNAIAFFYQKMVVDASLDETDTMKALEERFKIVSKNHIKKALIFVVLKLGCS
jgi:hypothetical protein